MEGKKQKVEIKPRPMAGTTGQAGEKLRNLVCQVAGERYNGKGIDQLSYEDTLGILDSSKDWNVYMRMAPIERKKVVEIYEQGKAQREIQLKDNFYAYMVDHKDSVYKYDGRDVSQLTNEDVNAIINTNGETMKMADVEKDLFNFKLDSYIVEITIMGLDKMASTREEMKMYDEQISMLQEELEKRD